MVINSLRQKPKTEQEKRRIEQNPRSFTTARALIYGQMIGDNHPIDTLNRQIGIPSYDNCTTPSEVGEEENVIRESVSLTFSNNNGVDVEPDMKSALNRSGLERLLS